MNDRAAADSLMAQGPLRWDDCGRTLGRLGNRAGLRMTAAECRKNADECVRLADAAKSLEQRNVLIEMALSWEMLAKNAADAVRMMRRTSSGRPALARSTHKDRRHRQIRWPAIARQRVTGAFYS